MSNGCYVGCTPPSTVVTHAPHVVQHLAFTGASLEGVAISGVIVVLGGIIFLVANHFLNKKGPRI